MKKVSVFIALIVLLISSTAFAKENKRGEYLRLQVDKKWGFIDRNGNMMVQPKYDWVYPYSDGMYAVKLDGLWGFVDGKGNVVIEPKYAHVSSFTEGLAAVPEAGVDLSNLEPYQIVPPGTKWGYIDKTGAVAMKFPESGVSLIKKGKS